MVDGDWVAQYLYKLSKEAKELGDVIESGGTHNNFKGWSPKHKRIIRLAMSEHIQETAEEVLDIFNGIPGYLADGEEHFFAHIKKQFDYLLSVLKNFP